MFIGRLFGDRLATKYGAINLIITGGLIASLGLSLGLIAGGIGGETFDELAAQSQQHGKEMFAVNDAAHLGAMNKMMELMNAGQMNAWMAARKAEFDVI